MHSIKPIPIPTFPLKGKENGFSTIALNSDSCVMRHAKARGASPCQLFRAYPSREDRRTGAACAQHCVAAPRPPPSRGQAALAMTRRHALFCTQAASATIDPPYWDRLLAALAMPSFDQLPGRLFQRIERQRLRAIENHQRVDSGKHIHFRRQPALLTYRRPLAAPEIDCLFKVVEMNIHAPIVRGEMRLLALRDSFRLARFATVSSLCRCSISPHALSPRYDAKLAPAHM